MSEDASSSDSAMSLSIQKRIDLLVDQFEAAWKNNERPKIEDFLDDLPEAHVAALFRELLDIDLAYRRRQDEDPAREEYEARFPDLKQAIVAEFIRPGGPARPNDPAEATVQLDHRSDRVGRSAEPATIGKYRVIGVLDEGGQATVYRAVHPTLEKELVIKISRHTLSGDRAARDRLVAEGRVLAGLEHPNLARVYDLDFLDGLPFLVIEYVRGRNLGQYAQSQPLSQRDAAALVANVARALSVAHAQGIVHQDIKPSNIIIDEAGQPRVIDFGMARMRGAWSEDRVELGSVSGTVQFMAPEQARGETSDIDQRSDIFALGAVLYWLLVRQPPFSGKTLSEALDRARKCEFDRQALHRSTTDRRLEAICLKAMATDQRDRHASADELAEQLERLTRRPNWKAWLASAAVALSLLVAIGIWLSSDRTTPVTSPPSPRAGDVAGNSDPGMEITVWQNDQPLDLLSAVPLRTGDDLRIVCEVPIGLHAALFWFDTDGQLHSLPLEEASRTDAAIRLAWPGPDNSMNLAGPEGTELVFVCASREDTPHLDDIEHLLAGSGPWSEIPTSTILALDRQTVQRISRATARGPGSEEHYRPGDQAVRRTEQLARALADRYEFVRGMAFAHVDR